MSTIADFRRQHPQYDDMSDVELAEALHRKFYSDLPKGEVFKRLGTEPPASTADGMALLQQRGTLPAPTPKEEESTLSALGRAFRRYDPRAGAATIIEDAPELLASAFADLNPAIGTIGGKALRDLGKIAARSSGYSDVAAKPAAELRAQAEERLAELGPRKFEGVFEEKGFGRRLGSLAETVAESALPTVAGIGTGLVTRSPAAAGAVMTAGIAPVTYGGIRERQQAEGIDDVRRAMIGTAASSALDVMTGVGGKVLSSTASLAAKKALEGGIRQAAGRILQTSRREAGTEMLQTVIEQVAGGSDPTTKEAMLEILEGGLAGALGGAVFSGATEGVTAPFRPKAGAPSDQEAVIDAGVREEFGRLVAQEVAAITAADPAISQSDAVSIVMERAEEIAAQAEENIIQRAEAEIAASEEGVGVPAEVNTGLDVVGGGITGAAPDLGAVSTVPSTPDVGEAVGGGLGAPAPSVSVPDAGAGTGVTPLAPAGATPSTTGLLEMGSNMGAGIGESVRNALLARVEAGEVTETRGGQTSPLLQAAKLIKDAGVTVDAPMLDRIQVAVDSARETGNFNAAMRAFVADTVQRASRPETVATQFDPVTLPIYEASNMTERKKAAKPVINDIIDATLGDVVVPAKVTNQIATQMAQRAARKEVFDPTELTMSVLVEQGIVEAPELPVPEAVAPELAAPEAVAPELAAPEAVAPELTAPELAVPEVTPQQVVDNLDQFAVTEAEDRGVDPTLFRVGADDVKNAREPIPEQQILEEQGPEAVEAYKAGQSWAQERIAEAAATTVGEGLVAPAAPEAGDTVPPTDTNVDQVLSADLTKAQLRRLEEAAGLQRMKLSNMQKRIVRSRSAEETMSLAGKLMLMARNPDDSVNILTSLFNSVPPPVLQTLLAPLETGDVVRLGERAGMQTPTLIDKLMRDEYIPYINRAMQRASKLAEKWADFTSRSPEGAEAMGDVMFYANMIDADPALAASPAEYLKIDPEFQQLTSQMAAEKDPKKKRSIKGRVTQRQNEIRRLYFGSSDADGAVVAGWNDVPPQGKQIFREARDYYRADFDEHFRLLMQRIDDAQFGEEDADRIKAAVEDMFKDASKRMIYFPLKRFGDYWVSIGKGRDSEFHMFESASAQDAFVRRIRAEGETRDISGSKGKDTLRLGLRKQTEDSSTALKGILDLLDGGNVSDIDVLKDHVFQMYLSALPESDMRRRFVHRQFKTGFSTDTLRTFANTAIASASQLGRLAHNYKFKNLIDASYAETEGNPSKRRLDTITRELEMRVDSTMSSGPEGFFGQAANLGAKATFLFLLSSPKSAFMNLTQLHIVGLPTLSAEFGEKATYEMAARYTGQLLTGKRIANPFRNEAGDIQLQVPDFTAENSAYIQGLRETDPDRYEAMLKAWDYAQEREVTESTFSSAANVYERSSKPSGELSFSQAARRGEVGTAALRATQNTVNAMGALFHHSERIGREIMYMSSFELAYERNLKQGMSPARAGDAAMEQATTLTNKGMFDFSNWNKSRAAKSPVGKLALQMRSYSIAMTSLLFRSGVNIVALNRTKAERLAAARVFFGVGALTTLYAGFRSSQFYLMAMLGYGLYKFVEGMSESDDEEEEIEQGYLNPETIDRELMKYADEQGRELSKKDMDLFIRSVWLPETFGPGGTMQEVLGLSDDAAKKLETAADIGLPGVFGVDISNSVALTNLWHPVDTKSDDPEVEVYETIGRIGLGPSGALLTAPVRFFKEANNGNLDKAIENAMPMAVRGFVKAQRLKDEGLVVGKNRDIVLKDPSFYDTYALAMQSLGFAEAQTSRAMQMDIRAGEIEREIAGEKTQLLDQRYRAILDLTADPSEEAERNLRAVERDIDIYNMNYPSNAIDADTKRRSFEQKQLDAAERSYGLGVNTKIPVRLPMAERSAGEFLEGQ
jgi:hypothetical protein